MKGGMSKGQPFPTQTYTISHKLIIMNAIPSGGGNKRKQNTTRRRNQMQINVKSFQEKVMMI